MKPVRRPIDLAQRLLPFQQALVIPTRKAYCVYTHSWQGTVFYVGTGGPDRPFQTVGRSTRWHDFVQEVPAYEISLVFWTDDAALARQEEVRLIRLHHPVCNLQHTRTPTDGGRPPRNSSLREFSFRVGHDTYDRLAELAEREQRSVSAMADILLRAILYDEAPLLASRAAAHTRPS